MKMGRGETPTKIIALTSRAFIPCVYLRDMLYA
jgi:hypothetical protein